MTLCELIWVHVAHTDTMLLSRGRVMSLGCPHLLSKLPQLLLNLLVT